MGLEKLGGILKCCLGFASHSTPFSVANWGFLLIDLAFDFGAEKVEGTFLDLDFLGLNHDSDR